MDHETEIIKQQMEDTRESLSEKLEALEQHVMTSVQDTTDSVASTVESVKDAVHDTVSSVRETVSETVDTVKEAFDIRQQVERHPWPMVAGATLVGFVVGRLLVPPSRPFLPPSRRCVRLSASRAGFVRCSGQPLRTELVRSSGRTVCPGAGQVEGIGAQHGYRTDWGDDPELSRAVDERPGVGSDRRGRVRPGDQAPAPGK